MGLLSASGRKLHVAREQVPVPSQSLNTLATAHRRRCLQQVHRAGRLPEELQADGGISPQDDQVKHPSEDGPEDRCCWLVHLILPNLAGHGGQHGASTLEA